MEEFCMICWQCSKIIDIFIPQVHQCVCHYNMFCSADCLKVHQDACASGRDDYTERNTAELNNPKHATHCNWIPCKGWLNDKPCSYLPTEATIAENCSHLEVDSRKGGKYFWCYDCNTYRVQVELRDDTIITDITKDVFCPLVTIGTDNPELTESKIAWIVVDDVSRETQLIQDIKAFEDEIVKMVEEWGEEKEAFVYQHLHARGMSLDKAEAIMDKARRRKD